MNTRVMATCVETYLIHIGGGVFWDMLCWTTECRSSDEYTENVLQKYHNILGGKVILWYNNGME